MANEADTVVALSSGSLPSGVAVVRVSGSGVRVGLETVSGILPPPRVMVLRSLRNRSGGLIDRGLVAFFPGPSSFTGEDIAEFHVHGGKAVIAALLETLTSFPRVRMAEPGEFSRRAFLNGKLDLAQAEGLADLVAAETESQRRLALSTADGAQSSLYGSWRESLLHARAMIEADLDFSDEQDVVDPLASVRGDLTRLAEEIRSHINSYRQAEMIRDGFDVVIVGPPNAGKSTLLNALARREVAIVSPEAGTTRDLIEVSLDLDGHKVRVTDTAGLRDNEEAGAVEQVGIARARRKAEDADLVLFLKERGHHDDLEAILAPSRSMRIYAKADLHPGSAPSDGVSLSAKTGLGMSDLLQRLSSAAAAAMPNSDQLLPARSRHVGLLRETLAAMEEAKDQTLAVELRAESLRYAAHSLGRISGHTDVEDLLDIIFSRFCIGK